MALEWHADKIIDQLKQATKDGLFETAVLIAMEARSRVHVDSGLLQASIKVQAEPEETGDGYSVEIGSDDPAVDYAIYQEIGLPSGADYSHTPYLRPALDAEGPKLADNIKKHADLGD